MSLGTSWLRPLECVACGLLFCMALSFAGCARVESQIAGSWTLPDRLTDPSACVVLRIRQDGTFDWGGTLTARLLPGFLTLRRAGDRVRGDPVFPRQEYSVVWHQYTATRSRIILMASDLSSSNQPSSFALVLHDAALAGGDIVDYSTVHWTAESAPRTEHCKLVRTSSRTTPDEPTGIGLVQPTTGEANPVEP